MPARKYYWLFELEDGKWCIYFGDYDRSVVLAEQQDRKDSGVKARDLTIRYTFQSTGSAHMHQAEQMRDALNKDVL